VKWVSVKEAADRLGMTEDYFRRIYCDPEAPLVTIHQRLGPRGGRRVRVLEEDVDNLLRSAIKRPA